ncbi:MAG: ATP-binding protein [Erysipelotrichaceae bacterium]|jgi:predicted ATP-dependent endonuclease of OLD family
MPKIHSLKIENYKGIKEFNHSFNNQSFVCLIGRGDSGKTTILQAIIAVLSPYWDYKFYDTDFYNGNTSKPIIIEASLYDVPEDLLKESKFGLYKRVLLPDNTIIDNVMEEELKSKDILTIRLIVNSDLEPTWHIINYRENQENVEIKANDRAKFNAFIISDYIDSHFSYGRGTPLTSILRKSDSEINTDQIIVEANRRAYESINNNEAFKPFEELTTEIKDSALSLGLNIGELKTLIDFNSFLVKGGNISLHDENSIPIRLKGKGTKRLLSIAIQLELIKAQNGILLIDEVEQGLEPDRAKFLVKRLKDINKGQVFITTHSNNVLEELSAKNICLMRKNNNKLFTFDSDFQDCIRRNARAFFSARVIICEGATEVGICRAFNNHLIESQETNLETKSTSVVDGGGSQLVEYCLKFKKAGFDVCLLCDSDDKDVNERKKELSEKGIKVIDCEEGNSIEKQLFNDLPWEKVLELLEYALELERNGEIKGNVLAQIGIKTICELNDDNKGDRKKIGEKAKDKGWFKRQDKGEVLGKAWIDSLDKIEDTRLKKQYDDLMEWIGLEKI